VRGVRGAAALWLLSAIAVAAQAPERPPLAEEVFKNIQILRGLPVDQFMATMGFFSASTGLNCTDCHVASSGGDWAGYAEDNARKQTARRMMLMVDNINRANFGGRQLVTCNTCHRGTSPPNIMPSLTQLYAELPPLEPGEPFTQAPRQPQPGEILGKYLTAVGGVQRLTAFRSFAAKGTYRGFDEAEKSPLEIVANAMGQRTSVVRTPSGTTTTTLDGRAAWIAAPLIERPVPVMPLTGQELEGLKLEARVFFPRDLEQQLSNWRVGFPTTIDDREVIPVQGDMPGGGVATLSFDSETGLLTRLVRFGPSPVGRLVTRVDYADYREVAGVKIPFRWTLVWLSGRSVYELIDVQPNAAIDPSRFTPPR
jgi:hypothetical protein